MLSRKVIDIQGNDEGMTNNLQTEFGIYSQSGCYNVVSISLRRHYISFCITINPFLLSCHIFCIICIINHFTKIIILKEL